MVVVSIGWWLLLSLLSLLLGGLSLYAAVYHFRAASPDEPRRRTSAFMYLFLAESCTQMALSDLNHAVPTLVPESTRQEALCSAGIVVLATGLGFIVHAASYAVRRHGSLWYGKLDAVWLDSAGSMLASCLSH